MQRKSKAPCRLRRSLGRPVGLLTGLFLLALSLSLFACSHGRQARRAGGFGGPVPVMVAKSVVKTIPIQIQAIGTVQPFATVSVKPQVGGQIVGVYFKQGQEVKAGQPLIDIDPRPYKAALEQAQAALAKDQATYEEAKLNAARWEQMYKHRAASQQQWDTAQASAAELKAQVEADQAAIRNATLNLEYCRIKSPIDGRTGALLVQAGNVVKANPDNPLVVINQIQPTYVQFALPEKNFAEIRKYMAERSLAVQASPPSAPKDISTGVLDFVDNTVDTTTGTIQFKALFHNSTEALWPGEFVNVTLTLTEHPNAILVPSQAVQSGAQGNYVFVVKPDMTVRLQPVVSGRTLAGETVIQRGLQGGETVVTDGQLQLAPGSKIRIKSGTGSGPGVA